MAIHSSCNYDLLPTLLFCKAPKMTVLCSVLLLPHFSSTSTLNGFSSPPIYSNFILSIYLYIAKLSYQSLFNILEHQHLTELITLLFEIFLSWPLRQPTSCIFFLVTFYIYPPPGSFSRSYSYFVRKFGTHQSSVFGCSHLSTTLLLVIYSRPMPLNIIDMLISYNIFPVPTLS